MISIPDMKKLEVLSEKVGVSQLMLMEHAGKGMAKQLEKHFMVEQKTFVLFAGKGNNAGDGFVAARYLAEKAFVYVLLFVPENELKGSPAANFVRLKNHESIAIFHPKDIHDDMLKKIDKEYPAQDLVLLDALLGTGLQGDIKGPFIIAIEAFNKMKGYKVAVDVPSGINAQSGEKADFWCQNDLIITFHDKKPGLRGNIEVVDIGIPQQAIDALYRKP